jgi:hypothetical protein
MCKRDGQIVQSIIDWYEWKVNKGVYFLKQQFSEAATRYFHEHKMISSNQN